MRARPITTLRVLDFDIEARPLSYLGGDFTTKEPTGIAWAWIDPDDLTRPLGRVRVALLGERDEHGRATTALDMLTEFRAAFDEADMVTGHYIRGYDLPTLQGAYLENGLPPLGPKLTQCTKGDLLKFTGVSKSQESLGAMLGLSHPKVGMNQARWRSANRLESRGIELTRERVVGDVQQHIELRARLLDLGALRTPRVWSPGGSVPEAYQP